MITLEITRKNIKCLNEWFETFNYGYDEIIELIIISIFNTLLNLIILPVMLVLDIILFPYELYLVIKYNIKQKNNFWSK